MDFRKGISMQLMQPLHKHDDNPSQCWCGECKKTMNRCRCDVTKAILSYLKTGCYKTTVQVHNHVASHHISRKVLLKLLHEVAEKGENEKYLGTIVATWTSKQ